MAKIIAVITGPKASGKNTVANTITAEFLNRTRADPTGYPKYSVDENGVLIEKPGPLKS